MIKDNEFLHYIREAEQPFSGWDFSYITDTGRLQEELLSWSYGSIIMPHLQKATKMLDMGTGGGEFLSKLSPLPAAVYATEAYEPNIPIAKSRLEPMGVTVVGIKEDDLLPFEDGAFDLIINRHESYSPQEVKRVSSKKGIFITQQVGGTDCQQINEKLGAPVNNEFEHWHLDYAVEELKQNGFTILFSKEEFPKQRFYDVGALVYYLKAIPWQIPDFQIEHYMNPLYEVHQHIQKHGYFDVRQHRFIIKAEVS